jgi:hypothetical protein
MSTYFIISLFLIAISLNMDCIAKKKFFFQLHCTYLSYDAQEVVDAMKGYKELAEDLKRAVELKDVRKLMCFICLIKHSQTLLIGINDYSNFCLFIS